MDETWILRPQMVAIGGRRYRKNYPPREDAGAEAGDALEAEAAGTGERLQRHELAGLGDEEDGEGTEGLLDVDVRELPSGMFEAEIRTDASLFGKVIGRAGATKARLEKESGATITIPRSAKREGPASLKVSAPSRSALDGCLARLAPLLASRRGGGGGSGGGGAAGGRRTHFLAIPLRDATLDRGVAEFQRLVPDPAGAGIAEEMFAPAARLHLTLCTLSLDERKGKDMLRRATTTLASALAAARAQGVLPPKSPPGQICVKGVQYMNDDPSAVWGGGGGGKGGVE